MDRTALFLALLIFAARVCDVSIGVIRVIMVTHGRRLLAAGLGFFEVFIWVMAVSKVVQNLNRPIYAIAYAAGFACGNYVGLTIERWAALGHQVVRVFSRQGEELAEKLRVLGFRITLFEGRGRDGPVHMLYAETERREVPKLLAQSRLVDPRCYYVVDDIRVASNADDPPPGRGFFVWQRK